MSGNQAFKKWVSDPTVESTWTYQQRTEFEAWLSKPENDAKIAEMTSWERKFPEKFNNVGALFSFIANEEVAYAGRTGTEVNHKLLNDMKQFVKELGLSEKSSGQALVEAAVQRETLLREKLEEAEKGILASLG